MKSYSATEKRSLVPPRLKLLAVAIVDTCNQECSFCSRRASKQNFSRLPLSMYSKIIEDVYHLGDLETLVITGGEPFMHPQFEDILRISESGSWSVKLNTNATILNEKLLYLLHRYRVKGVTVSIESDIAKFHDIIRNNPGSFIKTIQNVKKVISEGFEIYINTNAVPMNINRLKQVMLMAYKLGARGMNISRIYPIGRGKSKIRQYYIKHDIFKKAIVSCLKVKPFGFDLKFEDQVLRHLLDPRYSKLKTLRLNSKSKNAVGCFAGRCLLHINPDGNVLACTMLELVVGNLWQSRLRDIWTESILLRRLRNRKLLKGVCGKCQDKYLCGGCRGRAFALLGDELNEDPFCPNSKITYKQWEI